MEHESFEDPEVAKILNEHFVSIKVDREERPDLDQIYMTAVQMMTGQGGWPMSMFLTPDGKPIVTATSKLLPVRVNGLPAMLKIAVHYEEKRGGLAGTHVADDAAHV